MIKNSKGIILFLVLATVFIVIILANIIFALISSQSRLTLHQVSRIRAYYAAQAGMVYTLERLRTGDYVPGGANKYACLNGCIDTGVTATYVIPDDPAIPYKVQVTIYPQGGDINGTTRLDIKTEYTYTP